MDESQILQVARRLKGKEREAFLDSFCLGDAAMRQRIETRLAEEDLLQSASESAAVADHSEVVTQLSDQDPGLQITLPSDAADSASFVLSGVPESDADLVAGQWIGPYQLQERLGQGGMGDVWRAVQSEPVRREVAVKVIRSGIGSREILARFDAERQALALMNHPNIAKILDAGKTGDGQPYFVMELVPGTRLTTYCDQQRLSLEDRLKLFVEVCSGVQHAHQKGIIHRDLKPGNIIVGTQDGKPVPKIIDFGLAKAIGASGQLNEESLLTNIGQILGTLKYMSPEQASLNPVDIDTRTDIYALGVILYELLTGSTPLDDPSLKGQAALKVLEFIRDHDPLRPSSKLSSISNEERSSVTGKRQTDNARLSRALIGDLDWIVMRALEKDRSRRYESASGFAADIERFLHNEPVTARPPSVRYRFGKFVRKNRIGVTAAGLVLASLIAGMAGTGWGLRQAIVARDAETTAKEQETAQRRVAEQRQQEAEAAAERERLAKEVSNRRLTQIELINNAVFDIFSEFDIKKVREGDDPVEYVLGNRLAEMGKQLDADSIDDPTVLASLWSRLGNTLISLGLNEQAIEFLKQARELRTEKLGAQHEDTLTTMNNLAAAYRADGQYHLAMPLYEETFGVRRVILGELHPLTLTSLSNLALGYGSRREYAQALPLLEEVLTKRQELLGNNHPDTISTLTDLATGYLSNGEARRAIPLFEDALQRHREVLGDDHIDIGYMLSNLAAAYEASGQAGKAVPLFEESVRLQRQRFGRDHPRTLNSLNNLAYGYQKNHQPDKALPLFRELLELSKTRFGEVHPQTASVMGNLGALLVLTGNHQEALPMLEEALRQYQNQPDKDSQKSVDVMGSLGAAFRAANRIDESLQMFERALEIQRTSLGDEHPSTVNAMNNVAASYVSAGKPEKAVPLFETSLRVAREKLGNEHPLTLNGMNNLAASYVRIGDLPRAISLLEEWLTIQRTQLGDDHPEVIKRVLSLANQYRNAAEFEKAISAFQEVLDWRTENLGDDHPETLGVMNTLAATFWSNAQLDQSVPLLEESLSRMEAALGRDHATTQTTLANLGISYRDAGRIDEGLRLLEEVWLSSESVDSMFWVGPQLLATCVENGDLQKGSELGTELLSKASTTFPENSVELANQLLAVCRSLKATDKLEATEIAIRQTVAILDRESPDEWLHFEALAVLGDVLLKQKKFDEAEPLLICGYEGMKTRLKSIPPIRRNALKSTLENLVQLYEETERSDEMTKWEAELQRNR